MIIKVKVHGVQAFAALLTLSALNLRSKAQKSHGSQLVCATFLKHFLVIYLKLKDTLKDISFIIVMHFVCKNVFYFSRS